MKKNVKLFEGSPEKAEKVARWLEHLCCKKSLIEMGLFSLEKRRLWLSHCAVPGPTGKIERDLLSGCSERMGIGFFFFKQKEGRFRLDIMKQCFLSVSGELCGELV